MSRALSRRAALLAGCGTLAGCGASRWLGDADDPPLPGTRQPVLLLEEGLRADPELAGLPVTLPRPFRNTAWAQSGGIATHALHHLEVADTLNPSWRADIGTGAGRRSRLLATPVAGGGRVFTIDAADEVAAFDAGSGRELWRFRLRTDSSGDRLTTGGIALDGAWLYVTGGSGTVVALSADGGVERWRSAVRAPVRAAPTVTENRVLVLTADNQLFALDGATGEIIWRHAGVFEQAGILGGASPAAAGGLVVAAYSSGEVFGLELASGRPLWSDTVLRPRRTVAIGSITDIIGDPVIDRDRVIVAGLSGEMVALSATRGDRLWEAAITSTQMPWVAGEVVYVVTERNELVCLLRQNGRIRWVSPLALLRDPTDPESLRLRWAGPVLVSDRLLLAGNQGEIVSVSPYTGEVLGRITLGDSVTLPPIVADGTVYFLTNDGALLAYR